jgi:hypothetical protein
MTPPMMILVEYLLLLIPWIVLGMMAQKYIMPKFEGY